MPKHVYFVSQNLKSFSVGRNKHGRSFVKKSVVNELYTFLFFVIGTVVILATLYVDALKSL